MRVPEWEVFLKRVLSHVKFKFDHNQVYFELLGHMEDRYEDFLDEGMTPEAAQEAVLLCMGDADEIGREMNLAHSPLWGWVWRILSCVVIFLVVLNILPVLGLVASVPMSLFEGYGGTEDKTPVYRIELDDKVVSYDTTYYMDEVRYYEDGTLEVRYATWQNPFSKSMKWSSGIGVTVYDHEGVAYKGDSGSRNAGYYSRGRETVESVPLEAVQIVITKGAKTLFQIDLTEGRVMAE